MSERDQNTSSVTYTIEPGCESGGYQATTFTNNIYQLFFSIPPMAKLQMDLKINLMFKQ